MPTRYVSGMANWGLLLIIVVFTTTGCFRKMGDQTKPVLAEGSIPIKPYYASDINQSYLEADGECENFTSIVISYSSEYTTKREVTLECAASSSKNLAISKKHLAISYPEKSQVFTLIMTAVHKGFKSAPSKRIVNYSPPQPPTPGFVIASGGGKYDGSVTGISGVVTIGEPFVVASPTPGIQTSASHQNREGWMGTIHDY